MPITQLLETSASTAMCTGYLLLLLIVEAPRQLGGVSRMGRSWIFTYLALQHLTHLKIDCLALLNCCLNNGKVTAVLRIPTFTEQHVQK